MTKIKTSDIIPLVRGIKNMPYDKNKRNATVKRYQDKSQYKTLLAFHKVNDAELIEYITKKRAEGISPTQLFKEWYKEMVK